MNEDKVIELLRSIGIRVEDELAPMYANDGITQEVYEVPTGNKVLCLGYNKIGDIRTWSGFGYVKENIWRAISIYGDLYDDEALGNNDCPLSELTENKLKELLTSNIVQEKLFNILNPYDEYYNDIKTFIDYYKENTNE
jgi:hypothetical protein